MKGYETGHLGGCWVDCCMLGRSRGWWLARMEIRMEVVLRQSLRHQSWLTHGSRTEQGKWLSQAALSELILRFSVLLTPAG